MWVESFCGQGAEERRAGQWWSRKPQADGLMAGRMGGAALEMPGRDARLLLGVHGKRATRQSGGWPGN